MRALKSSLIESKNSPDSWYNLHMVRKILLSGDPKLRRIAKPVIKIDKKIRTLIKDLKDTLSLQKDPEGVGLAAPQLGKNLRIFLVNYKNLKRVVINPQILEISKKLKKNKDKNGASILEGCLSLPHYYSSIRRANFVKIRYLNEKGEKKEEVFKDFFAQVILHEIDHLNGILFLDRLIEQKRPLYKLTAGKWEEVELA